MLLRLLSHYANIASLPQDSVLINTFLRTLGERPCNVRTLCKIAFSLLNPFPMSRVKAKRSHYTKVIRGELEEIANMRARVENERDRSDDGQSDGDA